MLEITNRTLSVAVGGAEVSLELPEIAADAQVSVWAVPAEYRESGIFVGVRLRGQSQEIPACDLAACTHLGDVEYPAPEPMRLMAAKAAKAQEICGACDAAVFSLTASYPAAEIQSWPQQVKEADAYTIDANGDAPLLRAIAEQRGLDVQELVQRVHQKMNAFAMASGMLIGKRQALEDAIDAAQAPQELAAINWA